MEADLFNRLSRCLITHGTRRFVLALLGTAAIDANLDAAVARNGLRGKRRERQRQRRKDKKKPREVKHCISPTGTDLNEFYEIAVPIVAPFCTAVPSGRQWAVASRWAMNASFDATPAEFEPAGDTPLADFIAKFTSVKYVVDPGTAQEKTHAFDNTEDLFTGTQDGFVVANSITMATFHPLSVGEHVVDVFWHLSALHCDGFGDVVEENCLPAGEFKFDTIPFEVKPGHH
jgi:hypothetical protein